MSKINVEISFYESDVISCSFTSSVCVLFYYISSHRNAYLLTNELSWIQYTFWIVCYNLSAVAILRIPWALIYVELSDSISNPRKVRNASEKQASVMKRWAKFSSNFNFYLTFSHLVVSEVVPLCFVFAFLTYFLSGWFLVSFAYTKS